MGTGSVTALRLSQEQLSVVGHRAGGLRVLGGAGTGKTTVAAERALALLADGVPAANLLVLTCSARAADSINHHVSRRLPGGLPFPLARTFHAHARGQLALGSPHGRLGPIITDQTRRERLQALLADDAARDTTRAHRLAALASAAIGWAKDNLVSAEDLARFAHDQRNPLLEGIVELYTAYEHDLHARGELDHSEVVRRLALRAAAPLPPNCHGWHLVVDEFHDVNRAQYLVFRRLATVATSYCVLGDPLQLNADTRGLASPFLGHVVTDLAPAATVTLSRDFRATARLHSVTAAAASAIPTAERPAWTAAPESNVSHPPVILLDGLPDLGSEALAITSHLRELLGSGRYAPADCAILCRSLVGLGPALAEALEARDIPFRLDGHGLDPHLRQDLVAGLRLAAAEPRGQDLVRVLAARGGEPLALQRAMRSAVEPAPTTPTAETAPDDDFHRLRARVLADLAAQVALSVDQLTYWLLCYLGHLTDTAPDRTLHACRALLAEARVAARAGQSAAQLAALLEARSNSGSREAPHQGQAVLITSLYAARGLEWPIVCLPGLSDDAFPAPYRRDQVAALRELAVPAPVDDTPSVTGEREHLVNERRLFYLGLTRAKDALILSWSRCQAGQPRSESPLLADLRRGSVDLTVVPPATAPQTRIKLARQANVALRTALAVQLDQPTAPEALATVLAHEWLSERLPEALPRSERRDPTVTWPPRGQAWSYSQLERYQTCPRQYLYSYVLRLEPDEEAVHLNFGTVVHAALASLNESWRASGRAPDGDAIASAVSDAFLTWHSSQPGLTTQAAYRATAYLRRYYAAEAARGWRPIAVEEPFEMTLDGNRFRGRVDCVLQRRGDGLRLIDYKTSRGKDLHPAESIQLWLYECAWRQRDATQPITVAYYLLRHPDDRRRRYAPEWKANGQEKTHEHTDDSRARIADTVRQLVDRLTASDWRLPPTVDGAVCRDCAFRNLCPERRL